MIDDDRLDKIGAVQQFIKCGPVSRELRKFATEILVHTGQHYDTNIGNVFSEILTGLAPLARGSATRIKN